MNTIVGSNSHFLRAQLAPSSGSVDACDVNATAAAARELGEETRLVAGKDLKVGFVGKLSYVRDQDV